MNEQIEIRPGQASDIPFIFANWLNHYKHYSSFAKRIRKDVYMKFHHKIIEHVLARSTCDVFVATLKSDPDVLLGYLVTEQWPDGPVIHFTFVKETFRKFGIAKALIKASQIPTDLLTFTHWTYDMDTLTKRFGNYVYNPYKI